MWKFSQISIVTIPLMIGKGANIFEDIPIELDDHQLPVATKNDMVAERRVIC